MTTSLHRISSRSTLLLATCAFAFAFTAGSVRADDAPAPTLPKNSIAIDVSKTDIKSKLETSGSGNTSSSGSKGSDKSTSRQSNNTEQDTTYTITVRNKNSKIPAKNLTIEYHFYNVKSDTQNGATTRTVDDITSTESVDVAPGKTASITSQPIPHTSSATVSGGGGGGGYGKSKGPVTSPTQSSSTSNLLGWHVEVRMGDALISQKDEPFDLKDKLDQFNKQKK